MSTKDEAIAALRAAAFTTPCEFDIIGNGWCGDAECSSAHRRTMVHRRGSFTGADIDLADCIRDIEQSSELAWLYDLFDHELHALVNGRHWSYAVRAPRVASEDARGRDERVPVGEVEGSSATGDAPVAGVQEGTTNDETPQCAHVKHRGEVR